MLKLFSLINLKDDFFVKLVAKGNKIAISMLVFSIVLETLIQHNLYFSNSFFSKNLSVIADIAVYVSVILFGIFSAIIHIFSKMYLTLTIETICFIGMLISRYLYYYKNMSKEPMYLMLLIIVIARVYNTLKGRYKDNN